MRGHGLVEIDGGTLELDSTLTQNQQVMFTSNGGKLVLTNGTAFTGYITGFGSNQNDSIDLTGPGFGIGYAQTTLSYTGNTKQGVLTVTDGKLQAKLILFGNYAAGGFHKSSDGGGGSLITYVPPSASHPTLAAGH